MRHRVVRWAGMAAGGLLATVAARAETSPYSLVVGQSLAHESNVLRAPAGGETADTISTTSLRFGLDQPFGRQRVVASGNIGIGRYRKQSQLNNTSYRISTQLDWSSVNNWQGNLGANVGQQLIRDYQTVGEALGAKITERSRNVYGRAEIGGVTLLTFSAGLNAYDRTYGSGVYNKRDQRRVSVDLGARYQPSPALGLTGTLRRSHGAYPHYSETAGADNYDRSDVEAAVSWQASGASSIDGRLTWSDERHSQQTARGQQAWSGSAAWRWAASGKLSFVTKLSRDNDTGTEVLAPDSPLLRSDARQTTSLSSALTWAATEKIRADLSWRLSNQQLDGSFSSGQGNLSARDTTQVWALGLSYTPLRAVQLGCNVSDEKRTVSGQGNGLTYPYASRSYSCSGQFGWL